MALSALMELTGQILLEPGRQWIRRRLAWSSNTVPLGQQSWEQLTIPHWYWWKRRLGSGTLLLLSLLLNRRLLLCWLRNSIDGHWWLTRWQRILLIEWREERMLRVLHVLIGQR